VCVCAAGPDGTGAAGARTREIHISCFLLLRVVFLRFSHRVKKRGGNGYGNLIDVRAATACAAVGAGGRRDNVASVRRYRRRTRVRRVVRRLTSAARPAGQVRPAGDAGRHAAGSDDHRDNRQAIANNSGAAAPRVQPHHHRRQRPRISSPLRPGWRCDCLRGTPSAVGSRLSRSRAAWQRPPSRAASHRRTASVRSPRSAAVARRRATSRLDAGRDHSFHGCVNRQLRHQARSGARTMASSSRALRRRTHGARKTSSYKTAPYAKMSVRQSIGSPRTCSGERYGASSRSRAAACQDRNALRRYGDGLRRDGTVDHPRLCACVQRRAELDGVIDGFVGNQRPLSQFLGTEAFLPPVDGSKILSQHASSLNFGLRPIGLLVSSVPAHSGFYSRTTAISMSVR